MLYHMPTIGCIEAEFLQPEAGAMDVKRARIPVRVKGGSTGRGRTRPVHLQLQKNFAPSGQSRAGRLLTDPSSQG